MGIEIKIARIRKGITQEVLAKSAGISRYYLSSLESEKLSNPSRRVMMSISKELNEPIEKLFFDEK